MYNHFICFIVYAYFWHTFLIARMVLTWRLAFCGKQLKHFYGPYLRFVSLLYVIVSLFPLCLSLRCFIVLGHFDLITARFFGVLAARFYLFCFMNKYNSRSLKCFLASCFYLRRRQMISCVLGRVHYLEYDENSQVSYFVF